MISFFIVFVSEMDDNVEQIKKDLHMFLYHLRLPAEVFVVPLVSEEFAPPLPLILFSFSLRCLLITSIYGIITPPVFQ